MQFLLKALTRVPLPLLYTWSAVVYFVAFRVAALAARSCRAGYRQRLSRQERGRARRHSSPLVSQSCGHAVRSVLGLWGQRRRIAAPRGDRKSRTGHRCGDRQAIGDSADGPLRQLGMAVARDRRAFRYRDRRCLPASARGSGRQVSARGPRAFRQPLRPAKGVYFRSAEPSRPAAGLRADRRSDAEGKGSAAMDAVSSSRTQLFSSVQARSRDFSTRRFST